MNAFLVDLENKPGEIARVTEAIAARGVNIIGVGGTTGGSRSRVAFLVADEPGMRAALGDAECMFMEVEVASAALAHQPGTLARACRRLADAGINIEALMPIGMSGNDVELAFVTDQPAKAREILATAMA
jgi:hypothetical protein